MILKVYSLIIRVNQTKDLAQHESCEHKYGSNESVCNSLQKRNYGGCRYT